jgi:uncharacterized membrane protein (DUF485 family)
MAYFIVTLGGFLALFSIVLGTAIVSESLGWTIAAEVIVVAVVVTATFLLQERKRSFL